MFKIPLSLIVGADVKPLVLFDAILNNLYFPLGNIVTISKYAPNLSAFVEPQWADNEYVAVLFP